MSRHVTSWLRKTSPDVTSRSPRWPQPPYPGYGPAGVPRCPRGLGRRAWALSSRCLLRRPLSGRCAAAPAHLPWHVLLFPYGPLRPTWPVLACPWPMPATHVAYPGVSWRVLVRPFPAWLDVGCPWPILEIPGACCPFLTVLCSALEHLGLSWLISSLFALSCPGWQVGQCKEETFIKPGNHAGKGIITGCSTCEEERQWVLLKTFNNVT